MAYSGSLFCSAVSVNYYDIIYAAAATSNRNGKLRNGSIAHFYNIIIYIYIYIRVFVRGSEFSSVVRPARV